MLLQITVCILAVSAPIPWQRVQEEKEAQELRANMVKMAAMYDAMPAEAVASILKQLVESGKLEYAAGILLHMKDRNAARALTATDDPVLAATILERMRHIREKTPLPTKK